MFLRALPVFFFALSLTLLVSCKQEKDGPVYRVIGEAFAGPNQLSIRQDLSLRSPVITQAAHGEKLEVLDRKRRFVQVRTKEQKIGWVDMRLLISAKQMETLEEMAKRYAKAPSMGTASVFDVLNVHIEPNRFSPTFMQVGEKEKVQVIGHQVVERKPYSGETLELEEDETPQPQPKRKRARKDPPIAPPPPPPGPALPPNWLELSRTPIAPVPETRPEGKGKREEAAATTAPLVPMDDLTLIRAANGKVGWVVTNALFLEVPDEVAQYAEGKRITSYFAMGQVNTEEGPKQHWLWTTQTQKYAPFEFDGLRVFTYNARKKRYETAYRERELRGYFPVVVSSNGDKMEFRIVVGAEGDKLQQRAYAFDGTRVKLLSKTEYQAPVDAVPVSARSSESVKAEPSILDRIKNLFR